MSDLLQGGKFALGLFLGACTFLLAAFVFAEPFYWTDDPAVLGAMMGAFLAGVATVFAVVLSDVLIRVRLTKKENGITRDRLILILTKALSHNDHVTKVYRHWMSGDYSDRIHLSTVSGNEIVDKFSLVKPIYGAGEPVSFAIEDEAVCYAHKWNKAAHRLGNLRRASIALSKLLSRYEEQFEALSRAGVKDPRTRVTGTLVQSEVQQKETEILELRDLEQLVRDFVLQHLREANEILTEVGNLLKENYGLQLEVSTKENVTPVFTSSLRRIIENSPVDFLK